MLAFLRLGYESRQLARKIRESLADNSQEWCLAEGGLTHGDYYIAIIPRRLRMLDGLRLYKSNKSGTAETEVWLPLFQRLRLRAHVRYVVAKRANSVWDDTHAACDQCDANGDCTGSCETTCCSS